ncbi:hypothetical protein Rhow_004483 [Rhodococcus wratislaviensis]|uniref:Uncharacterized protein n=1 Tax=Rhodococcus wratislaviensis TaxID=44752 RepID=A0A402CB42_RHOWR|nr:hypothetical protein Rhow_004483 [Rhodococcus wratislaviensis]
MGVDGTDRGSPHIPGSPHHGPNLPLVGHEIGPYPVCETVMARIGQHRCRSTNAGGSATAVFRWAVFR